MSYSSITRKTCKCGCTNMPTISYEGYYHQHAPKEVLDRLEVKQKRKNAVKKVGTKLRSEAYAEGNYDEAERQYLIHDLDYVHSRIVRMTAKMQERDWLNVLLVEENNIGHFANYHILYQEPIH